MLILSTDHKKMSLIDNIQIRNLGFNQVTTIIIPPWNVWKSKVQNDKGLRINLNYPLTNLQPPQKIRLTVSTCKGFVDLTSDKSSITLYNTGGILECMFDIASLSPYVALDPNTQHYINLQCLVGENVNFDVELTSFDIGGDIVNCTNGSVTPGFVFDPVKNPDRASIIRDFSVDQVASLKIPSKTSPDWGDIKPEKVVVNVSTLSGLPRPTRWELIISECPGSFEEALPSSVGRTRDYHLISSSGSGVIEIQYDNNSDSVVAPTPGPPLCSDKPVNVSLEFASEQTGKNLSTETYIENPRSPNLSGSTRAYVKMKNGEVAALKFFPIRGPFKRVSVIMVETSLGTPPGGWEANISLCKGDFDTTPVGNIGTPREPACGSFAFGDTEVYYTTTLPTIPAGEDPAQCKLDASQVYYLNIRWKNSSGQDTCKNPEGCVLEVDLNYR